MISGSSAADSTLGLVSAYGRANIKENNRTRIVDILTSHDGLGDAGKKTGFWLDEFVGPYYVFKDAGVDITLASPLGGQPSLDPKSDEPDAQAAATQRFSRIPLPRNR